ncbi:L-2-amino-thiazoline-4-carboxylic acid hydrolase [Pseudonocardia sp. CA-107938]|uniref:L-2-amino-thiazoline-4-carboxylic acid hydrolase n=1 Tax=Pseudonocardia sp. CA-107938 TaxID=3240021 RepID=UPI003D8E9DB6
MGNSTTPAVDPTDWTALIEQAFFERLARIPAPADVEQQVRLRLAVLDEQLRHLVRTPMDAANIRFTMLAVAAFDVLEPLHGDAAAKLVDDCLNSPFREHILAGTATVLDEAADPFAAMVAASKEREATYFGPSFTFERPIDDWNTYVLDVVRCLFHEGLLAAGRTQLQAVLCRFDLNWADAIDPERHHFRFVRPVTYASGDNCRMCFLRQENLG